MTGYDLGFGTVTREYTERELPLEGSIPDWLSGTLLRNGPGVFETDAGEADHWFDGLAMLRRFAFGSGSVTYSNRVLRTDAYRRAHDSGFAGQFAAGGSYLRRLYAMLRGKPTDNANVHVARLGGEHVALTETPRGVVFDPETLETSGDADFADDLTVHHVSAHYRQDPNGGGYVGHGTRFGRPSEYVIYRVPDGSRTREIIARYPVDSPAYLHSVGVTPHYVIVAEPPFTASPIDFLKPGNSGFVDAFEWEPERGTRLMVFDRSTGDLSAEIQTAAFFVFHHVNAYENADGIVVDLVAYEDAEIVTDLSLEALAAGPDSVSDGELRRYRLSVDGTAGQDRDQTSSVVDRTTAAFGIELPRVAPAVRGQSYRYAYGQATERNGENGLLKVDLQSGETDAWYDGLYATEPVFVPEPGSEPEDSGVVLATALDQAAGHSVLLVIEAVSFTEIARARLPHSLPFGFHGRFYRDP